jgi:hypothetical protein
MRSGWGCVAKPEELETYLERDIVKDPYSGSIYIADKGHSYGSFANVAHCKAFIDWMEKPDRSVHEWAETEKQFLTKKGGQDDRS